MKSYVPSFEFLLTGNYFRALACLAYPSMEHSFLTNRFKYSPCRWQTDIYILFRIAVGSLRMQSRFATFVASLARSYKVESMF